MSDITIQQIIDNVNDGITFLDTRFENDAVDFTGDTATIIFKALSIHTPEVAWQVAKELLQGDLLQILVKVRFDWIDPGVDQQEAINAFRRDMHALDVFADLELPF